jgi:N-acetylmuramoyl-L-alanine amidase
MRMGDYLFEHPLSRLRALMFAATVLAGAQAASAADTGRVTEVRFWSLGDVTRVSIEVSSDFTYKSDRLSSPDRVFFDIHGAVPAMVSKGIHTIPVGDALIQQIRVAETSPGVTRVVLDLAQNASSTTSHLSNPDRLIVELRSKDKPAPPQSPSVTGGSKLLEPASSTEQPLAAKTEPTKKEQVAKLDPTLAPVPPAKAAKSEKRDAKESPSKKTASDKTTGDKTGSVPQTADAVAPKPEPGNSETASASKTQSTVPAASQNPREPKISKPAASARTSDKARVIATERLSRTESREASDASAVAAPAEGQAQEETASSEVVAKLTVPKDLPEPEAVAADPGPVRKGVPAKKGDRDLTRALGLKLGRVALDAGHGGHDVGTHGPSGYLEKDLTLDITRRLGALIEERLGSEVVYTRSSDAYVGLEDRTRIANESKADLFLSIHANSSPYRSVAGVETYILNFTTSKSAMQLAARENAMAESSIFNLQELINKIALKEKTDESREFANRLQTALSGLSTKSNDGAKNRGVKRAPFIVLIGATMPSVLAEIGFLSNASDEALLRKPEHRQKIAEALYKGIASYASTLSQFQVAKN